MCNSGARCSGQASASSADSGAVPQVTAAIMAANPMCLADALSQPASAPLARVAPMVASPAVSALLIGG